MKGRVYDWLTGLSDRTSKGRPEFYGDSWIPGLERLVARLWFAGWEK